MCILHVRLCAYCMNCYVYIACFYVVLLVSYVYIACFVICILHALLCVYCTFCYVYMASLLCVSNTRKECEEFCKFVRILFHLVFFPSSRVSCGYSSHFLIPFFPRMLVFRFILRNFKVLTPLPLFNTNHIIYTH